MCDTPVKQKLPKKLVIPASPFLKTLGYGTGVRVYEFTRSPLADKLRSPWAIKKIDQKKSGNGELKKRLFLEAGILRKLNHPNIVGYRAFIKSGKDCALAMEECTMSLGDMIENKREDGDTTLFPMNTIYKVGHGVSAALNYLHNEALILHCDLKSFNVLIKGDFESVKLCDFGVCLTLKKDGTVEDEEAEYIGTPAWAAPEVKQFPQIITTKCDIYSFGLILYEMTTLALPVSDETVELLNDSSEEPNEVLNDCFIIPNIDLGEEYGIILELMYCCASQNMDDRPNAKDLDVIFKQCLEK